MVVLKKDSSIYMYFWVVFLFMHAYAWPVTIRLDEAVFRTNTVGLKLPVLNPY